MVPPVLLTHCALKTTFEGVHHPLSTPNVPIQQFRGIKYASIPARFRQSKLFVSYPAKTNATTHGPICPQLRNVSLESELLGIVESELPKQFLAQNEFECLNLNITRPAHVGKNTRLPVMVWVHGGWTRGSGASWLHDGGAFVQKSIEVGRPVIMVTFNYRIGLFGTAASLALQEDNETAGDKGAGNYGLRDQQVLFEWIHRFISEFGGDPSNVTLFGESTGAADILCHMHSAANQRRHLFHRAILQSPAAEFNVPDVRSAGATLARTLSGYNANTAEELRKLGLERLIAVRHALRATDDGHFFRPHWKEHMFGGDSHHNICIPHDRPTPLPLQPVIIGDCTMESSLWSFPVSYWNSAGVVRRIRAICQSMQRGNAVLRAYDISTSTPEDELGERILDLINDARFAYPIDCIANALKQANGGKSVYRYVFDQESPTPGALPHHAADLVYLFDNVPLPIPISSPEISHSRCLTPELSFSDEEDEDEDDFSAFEKEDIQWMTPVVDKYAYAQVKTTIQERWLAFAYGQRPWNEEKAFVFGPEGETGERSWCIFEGRRRTQTWHQSLAPLGLSLVQKLGEELGNGPQLGSKGSF